MNNSLLRNALISLLLVVVVFVTTERLSDEINKYADFHRGSLAQVSSSLTSGLVARYTFDNGNAQDSAGTNHGTLRDNVMSTASGKYGGALSFDTGFVDLPNSQALAITGPITLSAWVRADSIGCSIISKSGNERGWNLSLGSSKASMGIGKDASTIVGVTSATTLSTGTWYHLVGTYEPGAAIRIYINGVLDNSNTTNIPTSQNDNDAQWNNPKIGTSANSGSGCFRGTIDDVRIYNRALTESEIQGEMGAQPSVTSSSSSPSSFSPSPSPLPPPPPLSAPIVSLSVSPSSITSGQSSTLTWNSTNATSCTASNGWSGTKATSGTQSVTPTTATTYTLTCSGTGGSANQSATVFVTAASIPPSTKFIASDRVQTTAVLNVRASAGATGSLLGTQGSGVLGTIVSGGSSADGFYWWNVNYDNGADGWSAEDFLNKYTLTPPPPPVESASPTSGLIAHYTFDSGTAQDSAGTNHGTLHDATPTASGKYGGAMNFDGTNFIDLPNSAPLSITGAITLSAWVSADSIGCSIISKSGNERGWNLYLENSKAHMAVGRDVNNKVIVDSLTTLSPGQWYYLVGTYEPGAAIRIYINGVLDNSNTTNIPTSQNDNDAQWNNPKIGTSANSGSGCFRGTIDDVRIYNRALSASEIQQMMNAGSTQTLIPPSLSIPVAVIPPPVQSIITPVNPTKIYSTIDGATARIANQDLKLSPTVAQAQARKDLMLKLAEKDPAAFLQNVLPNSDRLAMPSEVQAEVEKPKSFTGTLFEIHGDNSSHNSAITMYTISAPGEAYMLFPKNTPAVQSLSQVSVSGYVINEALVADSVQGSPQASGVNFSINNPLLNPQSANKELLLILVKGNDETSVHFSKDQIQREFSTGHFRNFYEEQSYGKVLWSVTATDWLTLPRSRNGYAGKINTYTMLSDALTLATRNGYSTNYEQILILFNFPQRWKDEFSGEAVGPTFTILSGGRIGYVATADASRYEIRNEIDGLSELDVIAIHEVGHNLHLYHAGFLGNIRRLLPHANFLDCYGRFFYSEIGCTSIEYGNFYDAMGFSYTGLHFNSYLKEILGWYNSSASIRLITQPGRYTITPYETEEGVKAYKIPAPYFIGIARQPESYYVEYRTSLGYGKRMLKNTIPSDGLALILVSEAGNKDKNWLIDATAPVGRLHVDNPMALRSGQKFVDPLRNVTIGPVHYMDGRMLVFDVCFRNDCGNLPPLSPPESGKFQFGDYVQVRQDSTEVRAGGGLGNSVLFYANRGRTGRVYESVLANGYYWWRVTFDEAIYVGVQGGWVIEEYLEKYTPPPDPPPACPDAIPTGSFQGCYYDNVDFTNLKVVKNTPSINFDWGTGAPDPAVSYDTFSVLFEGDFVFEADVYAFSATADDGIIVYVDGQAIISKWTDQSAATYTASKAMTAGTHRIEVLYYENSVYAIAKLSWSKVVIYAVPAISIIAVPEPISFGTSSTISWSARGATSCTAPGGWTSSQSVIGSQIVSPVTTTTYTLTCTGSGGSATASVTVRVIQPSLLITTVSMPDGTAGQDYSFQFTASGGRAPYKWGTYYITHPCCYVTVDSFTGVFGSTLSGLPPLKGTWQIGIQVTDANGAVVQKLFDWKVNASSSGIAVGSRVVTTNYINIWFFPSSSNTYNNYFPNPILGSQSPYATGTVTGGPRYNNGYTWWQIDFDSGGDGWTTADYLKAQ